MLLPKQWSSKRGSSSPNKVSADWIFVYADMGSKMKRCREKGTDIAQMTDKEVQQKIVSIDKKRARYYQFYTDHNWGDKSYYDLCINTSGKDIKKIASALMDFLTNI